MVESPAAIVAWWAQVVLAAWAIPAVANEVATRTVTAINRVVARLCFVVRRICAGPFMEARGCRPRVRSRSHRRCGVANVTTEGTPVGAAAAATRNLPREPR